MPGRRPGPGLDEFDELKTEFIDVYQEYSHLIDLERMGPSFYDLMIVGDTHGDLDSTLRIIDSFLHKKVDSIIFLGPGGSICGE